MTDEFRSRLIATLPRLRRFAYALTRDLDQGDDLVQETCVRALSRAEQWEPGTRLDSWVFRIAQNLWFDSVRANKVRGHVVDIDDAGTLVGTDGRDVMETRMALRAANGAIAQLPPEEQVLVALVCIDGLSYKEAAEIVEIPVGTVMSRLARARRNLHALLENPAPGDDLRPAASRSRSRV